MTLHRFVAIACTLPVLAGCALFRADQPGPGRVQEFVTSVERVHVETELARDRAAAAVRALQILAGGEFGDDAATAYRQLLSAIEDSERQADTLASTVATMHAAADPVFEHWAGDLEAIHDAALRQRGAQRLQTARERYRAITDAVDPAVAALRLQNQRLRDHALFLGHDLNPAALADVRPGLDRAAQDGRSLQAGLDATLTAARAYLEVSTPAVGAPPQTAAPAAESAPPATASPQRPVRLDGRSSNR